MPKGVRDALSTLKAGLIFLPLLISFLFRMIGVCFRLKLEYWRRKGRFREALKGEGVDESVVDGLCDEISEISLIEIISKLGRNWTSGNIEAGDLSAVKSG